MEKFYKQARTVALIVIIIAVVDFVMSVAKLWHHTLIEKELEYGNAYLNWLGCPLTIVLWVIVLALFVHLARLAAKRSIVKTASILAIIGICLFIVEQLVSLVNYYFATTWEMYIKMLSSKSIIYYVGTIAFAIGVAILARLYPKNSLARISGVLFVIFAITDVLYSIIIGNWGYMIFGGFEKLWYSTMFVILSLLKQSCLAVFLFGMAQNNK